MNEKEILLTIITPTFNSAHCIKDCIDSVIHQTWINKIEHLIIDNCSEDHTPNIVRTFQKKHHHIRMIREKDKGIYDAINKGIKHSKGKWIYILGSDDLLYRKDTIETVFKKTVDAFDIVYGNVIYKETGKVYNGFFDLQKISSQCICQQAIFYKKRLFETLGFFNIKYKTQADYDFLINAFLNKDVKMKYIDTIIALYSGTGLSSLSFDYRFFLSKGKRLKGKNIDLRPHYYILGNMGVDLIKKGGIQNFLKGVLYIFIADLHLKEITNSKELFKIFFRKT
jgi:glycosyltransferase involved in cell wall biosynthesis